ncbi:nuclear transport factor 2 family protein [Pedobacter gandavensis]|uniref:nuclear transport factor 2 family protein n=1 Tax=Pedobacter gandavensis TaxID=2679963 RepID=UPI00292E6CDC|nr:nuclear transport factor 2 family protein [Pedobacter gandavensis]
MKLRFNSLLFSIVLLAVNASCFGQTKQDSLDVRAAVLDYIESQHTPNPAQMDRALHSRMVKRTFWKDRGTGKEYLRETTPESMVLLAESYNKKKDKFPVVPKKEVRFLDISDRTASIKLIADDWIDYMHLIKLNGSWKIINVLWQYHDSERHQ